MQESTELNLWTVNKTFWTLIIGPDRFPLFPSVWGCRIGLHSRRQLEHESKRALLTPPPDSQRQSTRGKSTAYQEDSVQPSAYRPRSCSSAPVEQRGVWADVQVCIGFSGQWLCPWLVGSSVCHASEAHRSDGSFPFPQRSRGRVAPDDPKCSSSSAPRRSEVGVFTFSL